MIGHPMRKARNMLLRLFGAKIDKDALVYNTCTVFAPWNLVVGRSCIGPNTIIYNKDMIIIGDDSVVSQYSYLCTAGHDTSSLMLPLITAPIEIEDHVWIAANCFIGMGVIISEGAIVGARSAVFKDVEPWTIVGGNPAKFIKKRVIVDE
jgi:putative colanic acid biosynthesis acetyltransferase WcaF